VWSTTFPQFGVWANEGIEGRRASAQSRNIFFMSADKEKGGKAVASPPSEKRRAYSAISPDHSKFSEAVPEALRPSIDPAPEPCETICESGFGATQPPGPAAPQPIER